MKKSLLLAVVAAMLMVPASLSAQFKLGVKGGLTLNDMDFGDDMLETTNRNGFFVGPTLKVAIPSLPLGLDVSALYDQREVKFGEADQTVDVKMKQVVFPVNLRLTFGSSKFLGVYIFGGPQYGFNLDTDEKFIDNMHSWKMKNSNLSINLGAGVILADCLQVSANYNIDCGNSGEMIVNDVYKEVKHHNSKANGWQLSAAIYF